MSIIILGVPDQEKGSTEIDLHSHADQSILKFRVCVKQSGWEIPISNFP